MPGGSGARLSDLPEVARSVIEGTPRAVLSTVGVRGAPVAIPIVFALREGEIVTAIDHKPKRGGELARVRNIRANPNVAVLFDRYDDDWGRLAWVMVRGAARIDPPGSAMAQLAARYPQYGERPPEGDVIAITPARIVWWSFT